ncbi:hypothetical protein II654_02020 [bacterium]|nr:hypothetical protein [bacterium]
MAYNDHYWFLSEEDAFFSYLSSNKKKYVNYGDVNFKKGIADFLCAAKLNYAIDTFEKAVASYIIASQNNKNIISSSIFSST